MDSLILETILLFWISYLSLQHGMPLPNFVFIPNALSAPSKLQPHNSGWVYYYESSSQRLVQSLRHKTYQVRKQLEDVKRRPRPRNGQILQKEGRQGSKGHQAPSFGHSTSQATSHMPFQTMQILSGCFEPLMAIAPRP